MIEPIAHLIGGALRAGSGSTIERHNPSDTNDLVASAPIGGPDEVAAAAAAAAEALDSWRRATGPARAAALHSWGEAISSRAEELAQAIAREVGKPIGEARGEVGRAVVICRYYAGEAVREVGEVIPAQTPETTQFTLRDPLGPVGLITPWNFPLAIPLWKAAPALAFGNTVVLKPSENSPEVARLLAETAVAAELPAGVFNVVYGDGTTGAALVADQNIRGVSFTGSKAAGAMVQATASNRNIRCQTEMGGKNVVIVAADGDLDRAAALTAAGAFRFAGQKCTATSRVVVDRRVAAEFARKLETAAGGLQLGPVTDPSCAIGPLVNSESLARVSESLSDIGGELLFTGEVPSGGDWDRGHWLAPRMIKFSDRSHPIVRDELFAPVLALIECDGVDEAIGIANDTEFGLSASLFTSDLHAAFDYIRRIEVGLVRVNGDTTGVDPHAPFGGTKASSSGSREQGRAARDFYTETRTVQIHA